MFSRPTLNAAAEYICIFFFWPFFGRLSEMKLILVSVWYKYIPKQLFTSVSVKVMDIYPPFPLSFFYFLFNLKIKALSIGVVPVLHNFKLLFPPGTHSKCGGCKCQTRKVFTWQKQLWNWTSIWWGARTISGETMSWTLKLFKADFIFYNSWRKLVWEIKTKSSSYYLCQRD